MQLNAPTHVFIQRCERKQINIYNLFQMQWLLSRHDGKGKVRSGRDGPRVSLLHVNIVQTGKGHEPWHIEETMSFLTRYRAGRWLGQGEEHKYK